MSVDAPAVSLRQLQYLVAVADRGGFRRAAEACHVSQPALSAQVALAEQQLGVQVFERDRRQVRLSPRGAEVVEQARRVLLAASELHTLTRRLSDPFQGTLRLGIIPTIGPYLLPDLTPELKRQFPRLSLRWREQHTDDLVRSLRGDALDGILVAREAPLGDLEWVELGSDRFVLAAAPGHPLMRSTAPASSDTLSGARVLLLDDGHCFRNQALNVCAAAGAVEDSFRATSLGTLVQMVSAGDTVTLLPSLALAVENRRAQLAVRPFAAPSPTRTLVLAWRRGSPLVTSLQQLGVAIEGVVARLTATDAAVPRRSRRRRRGPSKRFSRRRLSE